jgi:hypothetical protein
MSLMSRFLARLYKLPPAETYNIAVERNLEGPMSDGIILRADLWPTAYGFKGWHRVRVQISSGAFPRFARKLGLANLWRQGLQCVLLNSTSTMIQRISPLSCCLFLCETDHIDATIISMARATPSSSRRWMLNVSARLRIAGVNASRIASARFSAVNCFWGIGFGPIPSA